MAHSEILSGPKSMQAEQNVVQANQANGTMESLWQDPVEDASIGLILRVNTYM
jgi:hypothetical protein